MLVPLRKAVKLTGLCPNTLRKYADNGTIKATNIGITTNGEILNENGPVVNIKKGATITATDEDGTGIYCAGNGTYNIEEGATITGGTGVEVRAGKLNVKGGTITGTAKELTSKANGGGTTTAGAGIAVVQHTTKLPIEVNITGGTITGIGEVLKAQYPEIEIWAVEPENAAILAGGTVGTHLQMGIGDGLVPKILNTEIYSNICIITDEEAITTAKDLACKEGIMCGISSGTNVAAAIKLAKKLGKGKTVVTILPETPERYFSTHLF